MLRRQRQIRTQVHKILDAGLFTLAFWLAHLIRSHWRIEVFGGSAEIKPFEDYVWLTLFVFPVAPIVLEFQGFYSRSPAAPMRTALWQALLASVWMTGLIVAVSFVAREQPARSVIILSGIVSFLMLAIRLIVFRRLLRTGFGQARLGTRLLLIGSPEETQALRRELSKQAGNSLEIAGEMPLEGTAAGNLVERIHDLSPSAVVIAARHTYFETIERAIHACELEGVEVWLMADLFKTQLSQTSVDDFFGRPIMVFRSGPEASWQGIAKQFLDIFGALALLLICALPMALVALLIKLTSKGPVFFRQQRSGLNGLPFTMLKFRSMVTDAEQRQHELAVLNEMSGPVFKVTHDPRITPIGKWLRKYSIDEFPQLFNVLRGEMSLVGPRPLPVDEVRRFDDLAHRRRLSVKPGITCLWQISGRSNVTDFRDWVRLDLEYIDNWSLWLDLKILLRTVPVVLLGTGAK
ncbi:MAG: sugar transferase [Verrucomicrobia bacterium]|nr:sugar transferase [Verrucomicrobiota bacterium]